MSETKRRIFIIVVLLLVILFGVGQFFAYSNPNNNVTSQTSTTSNGQNPTQLGTQVYTYTPQPLASSTVERGSCFANSIAALYRSDAWRCTVGNSISDPCFEIPGSTSTLQCGVNPTVINASSSFVLRLIQPLPAASPAPSSTPSNWAWLVQLSDGTICSPFTGTRPFDAGGDVATYACNGGPSESMILGDLNNASSAWTAEIGTFSTSTKTYPPTLAASSTVPITAIWQ